MWLRRTDDDCPELCDEGKERPLNVIGYRLLPDCKGPIGIIERHAFLYARRSSLPMHMGQKSFPLLNLNILFLKQSAVQKGQRLNIGIGRCFTLAFSSVPKSSVLVLNQALKSNMNSKSSEVDILSIFL